MEERALEERAALFDYLKAPPNSVLSPPLTGAAHPGFNVMSPGILPPLFYGLRTLYHKPVPGR